jgi:3-phenylpropionate/trans-cinnamate dioxygenase ferredoxin reductase subunit
MTKYLIIGGGTATARAVEGIREVDYDGSIMVVTAEPHLPYDRPPLSKGVLLGSDDPTAALPHEEEWYRKHQVDLRLGDPVASIDPDAHTATMVSGEQLAWERLLLATGSSVRRLDVPGADLPGVFSLRTLDDSLALLDRLKEGKRVAIVGAGWIGLEVAAAARSHGCSVVVVEPQSVPLLGVMGERIGTWFADLHRSHGVDFRFGAGVASIDGTDAATGLTLTDGTRLRAGTVVVGVGIRPNTMLAEAAGLTVDNGIVTDEALRASRPDIWAAGDVANWQHRVLGRQVRVEHWANAYDGGLAAGRSMAGAKVVYDPQPFFYSDRLRPARRRDGGRAAWRSRVRRLHGLLGGPRGRGGTGARRHARQHLGHHRRDHRVDPCRAPDRPRPAGRPGDPAGRGSVKLDAGHAVVQPDRSE